MKKKYTAFLVYLAKNFTTGFFIVLGGLTCIFIVKAYQELTTNPTDSGNQSLSTPLFTMSGGIYERDYMSLQALSQNLGIKKTPKIMFISSVNYTGNLGGLAGADAKCQALADAGASLPSVKNKRWMAFLSDNSTPVKVRIPYLHSIIVNPLYATTPTGNVIFTNSSAVNHFLRPDFGFPATFNFNGYNTRAINIDEKGVTQSSKAVFTGTNTNGDIYRYNTTQYNNCNNWTYGGNPGDGNYSYSMGNSNGVGDNSWIYNWTYYDCDGTPDNIGWPTHIYCLEL